MNLKVKKSVKFLTNQLGEIRSLDVSLKLWRKHFSIAGIDVEIKKMAKSARKKMATNIGQKDRSLLNKATLRILGQLRQGKLNFRSDWEKRCKLAATRAQRCYAAYRREDDIESLHRLRIRLKQWRYLLELNGSTAEDQAKIAELKTLQDDIGNLHDMEVLCELLKKRRMKHVAQETKAGHDLKEIRRGLKAEMTAGQKSFLSRHDRSLAGIFPKEKA